MFLDLTPGPTFLQHLFRSLTILALFSASLVSQLGCETRFLTREQSPAVKSQKNIDREVTGKLPSGERWMRHLKEDLLPFWTMELAYGQPKGNFPTFRCNDGALFDPSKPCVELKEADPWISKELNREYVRMKSRQTFLYGAAYHLTGDESLLEMAKAGVDYLRKHALEKSTGSAISHWTEGVPGPPVLQRTSQDLAYAQLGLAFFYYLTRDDDVLKDVIRLKDHIFRNYHSPAWDMLMWVKEDPEGKPGESNRKELVAQLDQINAYMLLLTPLLPDSLQAQWEKDLLHLSKVMIDQFYNPKYNLFWGSIHNEADKRLGKPHTDFGHTIKAFWMIYQVGKLTQNKDLIAFAESHAPAILEKAYLKDSGSWASKYREDETLDENKEWWIYAELDQMAATLSLKNPSFAKYLISTYNYWFKYMVDLYYREVWHMVTAPGYSIKYPKIHLWKNGYHSLEHTLIGYVTSQAVRREPIVLHYAFKNDPLKSTIRPYFYSGKIQEKKVGSFQRLTDYKKVRITFTDIQ